MMSKRQFLPRQFIVLASIFCLLPALSTVVCRAARVEKTTYNGLEAFRLNDGQTEAIVENSVK